LVKNFQQIVEEDQEGQKGKSSVINRGKLIEDVKQIVVDLTSNL
jgi:hypothetical protein